MNPLSPKPPRDDAEMEELLTAARPLPRPAFRGELRRRLSGSRDGHGSERRLRLVIAAYAGSGGLLLALVVLGLAGAGPLSA
jgi:hypothetical protein